MFIEHTQWTEYPCQYVIAIQGFRRAWLAGPYRTRAEANAIFPHVFSWATAESGDTEAANYTYQVVEHHNGETCSILGQLNAQFLTHDIDTRPLRVAAPVMRETLAYVAQVLAEFKPDLLRQLGLDAVLEQVEQSLAIAGNTSIHAPTDALARDHD